MRNVQADDFNSAGPTADEIRDEIDRILASDEFHSPERGRRFLRFIVTETLAGRSQFLKAFTIANEIFGREASFDAQNDPVVRIEAGRIRRALERYYLVAGQSDGIVVTIPKGGYVPHFEYVRTNTPAPAIEQPGDHPADPGRPPRGADRGDKSWSVPLAIAALLVVILASFAFMLARHAFWAVGDTTAANATPGALLVVEAFNDEGQKDATYDIAHGLRDEIIGQLAKFNDVVVVADPSKVSHSSAGYILQGNVQLDRNRLRLVARLARRSDAAVIWANNYDADLSARSRLEIQADIGQQVAISVAQPYGALFVTDTDTIAQQRPGGEDGAFACTLAYYSYRRAMDARTHGIALDCLREATQQLPGNAASWALLSMVYLDELRFRFKLGAPSSPNPLQQATLAANRASALAPRDPRVLEAVMLVSFFNNDVDKALKAGAEAYAVNANNSEVAGEYGIRLAMSGKWQSGCELISNAINKEAGPKGYYEVGMALCAFMRGDDQAAELWSRMSDLAYNPMHHLVLLSILGAQGKIDEASGEKKWLAANAPDLMNNVRREVSLRLQRPEDRERFFEGLRAAGVAVDLPVSKLAGKS